VLVVDTQNALLKLLHATVPEVQDDNSLPVLARLTLDNNGSAQYVGCVYLLISVLSARSKEERTMR
jgi:hypothetical protein